MMGIQATMKCGVEQLPEPFWTGDVVRPERIDNLDDVKTWIADHDGRTDAYWAEQFRTNERNAIQFGSIYERIGRLEIRVAFWAGGGAVIGSLSTFFATKMLGG